MEKEIVNRVANSKLKVIDLEDFYPDGERVVFDVKDWLYEGLVLREKEFRQYVNDYNWTIHNNQFVALNCSTDAIIPAWAFMLVALALEPYANKVTIGDLETLETSVYQDIIGQLDVEPYADKPVIIKGCANKPVPVNAYIMLSQRLQSVAKSIMYGEACSSVPLYKKK